MTQAELERCAERSEELELYCKLFDGGMLLKSLKLLMNCIRYAAFSILHEIFTSKNYFKRHKQRHLVFEMKSKIFFVAVQDPFHI